MQQGSSALALLVALTSVSASYLYINNVKTQQKQEINKVAVDSIRENDEISDINSLARFRSLIENKKVSADVYEPAIFPTNYFETEWKLNLNQTIVNQIDSEKGSVQFLANGVKFSQKSSGSSFNDLVKVLENGSSAVSAASVDRTISIEKVNFKEDDLTLATSLDVKLVDNKGKREVFARIPLKKPVPYDPVLEMRKVGSSTWLQTFSEIEPGNYEIRVLGSGVVLAAEVTISGVVDKKILGLDTSERVVKHKAVNIRAKNEEIGRFTHSFNAFDMDYSPSVCMATPADGTFTYQVRLLGADGEPDGKVATGQITTRANIVEGQLSKEDFIRSCNAVAECEYRDRCDDLGIPECANRQPWEATETAYFAGQLRSKKYPNYSWHNHWDWIRNRISTKAYKICDNIEKMAQVANLTASEINTLSDADLVTRFRQRGSTPEGEYYVDYFAYKEPECKPLPVFQRKACGCFATGTRIRLEDGSEKPIGQLQAGDRVWNPLTKKGQSIRHMTRGPEKVPLFRIASQGQEVTVTGTHPFATRRGVVPAFQLEVGEEIQSVTGTWEKIDSIATQTPADNPPIVWNLELEGPNDDAASHFVEANGLVTGDLLLQTQLQNKQGSN